MPREINTPRCWLSPSMIDIIIIQARIAQPWEESRSRERVPRVRADTPRLKTLKTEYRGPVMSPVSSYTPLKEKYEKKKKSRERRTRAICGDTTETVSDCFQQWGGTLEKLTVYMFSELSDLVSTFETIKADSCTILIVIGHLVAS